MENKVDQFRIFIEDNEVDINYSLKTTNETIVKVMQFILNELKKKHQTKYIVLKNVETDEEVDFTRIISKKIEACYVSIKCKPFLKTKKSPETRPVRDVFDLTDNETIRVQKFKDLDVAKEKVTYNLGVIERLNEIFKVQNQYFINDEQEEAKESKNEDQQQQQQQKQLGGKKIDTPPIFLNQEKIQDKSVYTTSTKSYEAVDDNPNDIKKQKKDFQKTGGAGGYYNFVKEAEKKKEIVIQGYTIEELAQHNQPHDCWTAYQGKIYDITNYINRHPGGQKIMLGAGKDCTSLFMQYHSWVNASFMLQKYQVGFLVFK